MITLLTSVVLTPETPSLVSKDWITRSSQNSENNNSIVVEFSTVREALHVAVFSKDSLALREVVVYGECLM